jgi:HD-GYP domain-containing protein (c-di-GMP phosphodiesterase class II)
MSADIWERPHIITTSARLGTARNLVKPDELTIEEALEMRKHSVLAEELFRLITGGAISGMPEHLVRLAHDSAVYHHEWRNGQGYPFSLYRDEIPLIARITSICDVYDAITSDRSYRKLVPRLRLP